MKKSFLLIIIFIMFVVSLTTLLLILNYVDPEKYNFFLSFGSLLFSYTLTVSSFLALLFYFFKKIYFRWKVYIYHVLTSFRQGFLISVFWASVIYFNYIWAPIIISSILLFIILFFLELFIENQEL